MWSVVAAAIAAIAALYSTYSTNKNNKQLTEENREWEESQVDKQNAYNDPQNQVKRLQSAGYNPASLLMGNSTGISGNLSASPGSVQTPQYIDPISSLSNTLLSGSSGFKALQEGLSDKSLRQARIDNIQAQTQQLLADAKLLGASETAQRIANQYADARETWAINGMKSNVRLSYAQSANFKASTDKLRYEIENLLPEQIRNLVAERKIDVLQLDVMSATIADLKKSAELKGSQIGLTEAQTSQASSQAGLAEAQSGLTEQESQNYSQLFDMIIEKYNAEIENLSAQAGLSKEETFWKVFDIADQNANKFMGTKIGTRAIGNTRRTNKVAKRIIKERMNQ